MYYIHKNEGIYVRLNFYTRESEVLPYSLFTNDMQKFSGNIFAAKCHSYMGFSPLIFCRNCNIMHMTQNM